MQISVVIPTRNRKPRLLSLLDDLNKSDFLIHEVIIVDSSDEIMMSSEYNRFENLHMLYIRSLPSVCVQRNCGIRAATGDWIFICDDDIEVPCSYLRKLATHIRLHPEAGAVSGHVLQKVDGNWVRSYPLISGKELILKSVFLLGIWGEVVCSMGGFIVRRIQRHYNNRGNYILRSGWPVITKFEGEYNKVPTYGLGAALIRKDWLLSSPYDESLDVHGIGDNYGVSIGFPDAKIQIVDCISVYHHQEPLNRLKSSLVYIRRGMALDTFIRTGRTANCVSRAWFLWSISGNTLIYLFQANGKMFQASLKLLWKILSGSKPNLLPKL